MRSEYQLGAGNCLRVPSSAAIAFSQVEKSRIKQSKRGRSFQQQAVCSRCRLCLDQTRGLQTGRSESSYGGHLHGQDECRDARPHCSHQQQQRVSRKLRVFCQLCPSSSPCNNLETDDGLQSCASQTSGKNHLKCGRSSGQLGAESGRLGQQTSAQKR